MERETYAKKLLISKALFVVSIADGASADSCEISQEEEGQQGA